MKVTLQPVQSSNIASVGHEENTLVVKFKNGTVYTYDGVSAAEMENLVSASSIGKHFICNIKGQYAYKRHSQYFENGDELEIF